MNVRLPETPVAPERAGAQVTFDLPALVANWQDLKSRFAGVNCGATVKANGYGVGIEPVVDALYRAGCDTFFVAVPAEGQSARHAAPDADIYILNGLFAGQAAFYADNHLIPVLSTEEEFEEWSAFGSRQGNPMSAAIHVDTGMNRLGLTMQSFQRQIGNNARMAAMDPRLIMTHLACADTPDHPLNALQLERFRAVRALLPDVPASMCNSAGIFLGPDFHFDVARPGIALYGGESVAGVINPMKPVASLATRVLQLRTIQKGQSLGYGAAQTLDRDTQVAIVSCGYADGYMRLAGSSDLRSGAKAFVSGHHVPLAGRVSMDMIAIDITDLPAGQCERGTMIELYGANIPIDDVARCADTIGYELLTNIGNRASRHYIEYKKDTQD